jgi:hypothetical protein
MFYLNYAHYVAVPTNLNAQNVTVHTIAEIVVYFVVHVFSGNKLIIKKKKKKKKK